ncbi:MAG: zinc ribbon domain-containing protein [Clostridiales bacterium]|nr:zinc ribbon domain-containing protein [Clostridiales bacterium]
MNSSNSFNICPRCGNSNALNAKYCSRCGGQLKVPEEPVVCHKCHTHNTPMANFCRNCGTTLKVGSETKLCPRCGKEVSGDKAICECGYSFVTYQQTIPSTEHAVDVSVLKDEQTSANSQVQDQAKADKPEKKKQKKEKVEKVYSTKGGRGWAIAALVFLLLFAYYIVAPYQARPSVLVGIDGGFTNGGSVDTTTYGYETLFALVSNIMAVVGGAAIGEALFANGVAGFMIGVLVLLAVFTLLVHLIVVIVRIFTTKRSKKMNLYFMIVAIVATVVVGLMTLFKYVSVPDGFMSTVAGWFILPEDTSLGLAIWAIPVYFWFFYLFSLCAKAKQLKEKA